MAFNMKGSSLYGKLNLNRGGQANRPDGKAKSSAFQKTNQGAFITDIDELTGEKSTKRATYKETRKAEGEGKGVTYTNKEDVRRTKEDIANAKKGLVSDGTEANKVNKLNKSDSREKMEEVYTNQLASRKKYVKDNKSDAASKEARHLDRAAQDEIERTAVIAAKKKKGDTSNTKALTKDQRDALKDNKTSTRKDKPDLNKPDTESGISTTYEGISKKLKKTGPQKKSPAKQKERVRQVPLEGGGMGTTETKPRKFLGIKTGGTKTVQKRYKVGESKAQSKTVIKTNKKGEATSSKTKKTKAGKKSKIYNR